MSNVLISYASKPYIPSQKRLGKTARDYGVDRCLNYSPASLYTTGFFLRNYHVLRQKRGAGYWLWKPYIILRTLRSLPDGDIVLYSDVDNVITGNLAPLFDLAHRNSVVLFANHTRVNRVWTKRDCFVLMGCDTNDYHEAEQLDAALIIVRNTLAGREFASEWLRCCEDRRILTDDQNTCGYPDLDGFREHRHDQSVLSLLARQKRLEVFRNPTQRGNPWKIPEHRVNGEFLKVPNYMEEYLDAPYSTTPWVNSPYGTILENVAGLVPCDTGLMRKFLNRSKWLRRLLHLLRKRLGH